MPPVAYPLGTEEWERIHFKHCYHHLLQFGLILELELALEEDERGDAALM